MPNISLRGRKPFRAYFSCILPHYVVHDITQEFFKNSHFESIARNSAMYKVWGPENITNLNLFFAFIFIYILPDYVVCDIIKEF